MGRLANFYKDIFNSRLTGGLVWLCWVGLILFPHSLDAKNDPAEDFTEILIYVQLPKFGGMEIPAAIREETVFLSVTDLFDFLQIKNTVSEESIIGGYLLNQTDEFFIDPAKGTVYYRGEEQVMSPADFIRQDGFLYLKSSIYGEIFGLNCSFDFRNLSVTLSTELDLPVFRLKRQEMLRKNLNQLQETVRADTVFQRKNSLANFSMVDWGITNTQQFSQGKDEDQSPRNFNQSRINLSLGGELAYGELAARLNFIEGMPVQHKNQFYQWRYVNNDQILVKQITVGRINAQKTSTLYAPVTGIQVTNAATIRKKSFGSYRISDYTEPEWLVELYVNNLLIDYVQADASGFYTFEVPLMYGSIAVQLKFYGPYGEEHSSEEFLHIPFNFMPKNETEYSLSAGLVEDGKGSVFSRGSLNYGLSNQVTLGGGVEYLSSLADQPFMPFVHSSIRLADGLMFSGDYMPGVRAKGLINYRLPSNLQLDIHYTKLEEGQKALFYNYLEERKLALSMPIKGDGFSLFSRLSLSQMVYPTNKFTMGELLFSSMLFGINTQVSTFGTYRGNKSSNVQTLISQTYRLPGDISLTPQLQYNYSAKRISQAMAKLDKRIFNRGFLNVFYQNNLLYKSASFGIGFRYDFSFANTSLQVRQSKTHTFFTQSANGSLMYDGNTGYLDVNNKVNVGKGAITVLPFLDINANGKRDEGESPVKGLKLKVRGGQAHYDKKGEAIRITNLMAYEDCILELDKSSFDNVAWRIKDAIIKVSVNPNQFKKVEVPISVMGEVAGMVYLEEEPNGMGRIKMNFYDEQDNLIHSALTERDGYFSYMELGPGNYKIMPDSVQLQKLGYTFQAEKTAFTIAGNPEGDYFDDLEFTLHKTTPEKAGPDSLLADVSPDLEEETVEKGRHEELAPEVKSGTIGESNEDIGDLPKEVIQTDQVEGMEETFTDYPLQDSLQIRESDQEVEAVRKKQAEKNNGLSSSSGSIQFNPLKFTLKNSNPELLEKLLGENIEAQKQVVKSMLKEYDPMADVSQPRTGAGQNDDAAQELVYKIQLLASESKVPLDHPYFKGVSDISEEYRDGLYKYTYHPTTSLQEARENLQVMKSLGFKDAFLADYRQGKRLEAEDLTKLAQINEIKKEHPDTYFRIQILVSEIIMDTEDPAFKGIEGIDYYTHKGHYKYTYGIALKYGEAVVLLGQVRAMGFEDAFIVSFYKRRRLE